MRLWHEEMITKLPRMQLLGQHRECTAMRGMGWGRKHSTVDYVWNYPIEKLVAYHFRVMEEMERRGYSPDPIWFNHQYRGKRLGMDYSISGHNVKLISISNKIYNEHDEYYYTECILNLAGKNIYLGE